MSLISRIGQRVFKLPSDSGQGHLTVSKPRSNESGLQPQNLCSRCQSLDLSKYIERPWTAYHPLNQGFHIATIGENSIDDFCLLCKQLAAYLPPNVQRPTSTGSNEERSLELWCCYAESFSIAYFQELITTYFYILYSNSTRELRLFSTKPPRFRISSNSQSTEWKRVRLPTVGMSPDVSRSCDYGEIKGWFETCRKRHDCGQLRTRSVRPKRLIDCKTRQLRDVRKPYVCLSYLWGTTKTDQEDSELAFPDGLPRTIADAMTVTLGIGMRYLWVDRYCIDQSNAEEKHDNIQNMDAIYQRAKLTIIAAAGVDPNHGLPGVSCPRLPQSTLGIGGHKFVAIKNVEQEVESSRWNTRAWTFQEGLLSRRRLVFTETQAYFQCLASQQTNEPDVCSYFNLLSNVRVFPDRGIGYGKFAFYDRIEEYYGKELSYPTDIVNAFTGIIQAFQHRDSLYTTQLYGIPLFSTHREKYVQSVQAEAVELNVSMTLGLAWQVDADLTIGQQLSGPHMGIIFPSWSWAAFKAIRPSSNSDRLLYRYRGFMKNCELHKTIDIRVYHRSGTQLDLVQFICHHDDYTSFQPRIDITSMTITGSLGHSDMKSVVFSACPEMTVHLHKQFENIKEPVTAVFLGCLCHQNLRDYDLVFLLVERLADGRWCRIGLLSQQARVGRKDYILLTDTNSLQQVFNSGEWHRQTLVLV